MAGKGGRAAQPKGATQLITTHPAHAVRGGLSLLVLPLGGFMVLAPLGALAFWGFCAVFRMSWLGVVLGCCGSALAAAIYDHAFPRISWDRRRAAGTVAWLSAVFSWVMVAGPSPAWFGLTEVTALVLGWWWFFVKTEAVRGFGGDGHAAEDSWAKTIGLAETAKPRTIEDSPEKLVVEVSHPDNTHEDAQRAAKNIPAKSKSDPSRWRWSAGTVGGKVAGHLSRYTYWRTNRLDDVGDWPGPDKPGAGIWELIDMGVAEDGQPSMLQLTPTADDVGSPAMIVAGVPGSAKTAFVRNLLGTVAARRGVAVWGSDTAKAGQWVTFLRPLLDWFSDTLPGTKTMVDAVLAAVPERTKAIVEATGLDRWTQEAWEKAGIPFLLVVVEEASQLLGPLEEELTRLGAVVRGAGVLFVFVVQRPSESQMDTDLRNLIDRKVAFRMVKQVDATMVLSDETIDAGASPWTISQAEQGVYYAEWSSEPPSRWPMRRRTHRPVFSRLIAAVATYADRMDWHAVDPITAAAADAATKGAYSSRDYVTVRNWRESTYGKAPQLNEPEADRLIRAAEPRTRPTYQQQEVPVTPQPTTVPRETGDETAPEVPDDMTREEVDVEVRRIEERLDAETDQELGPDPDPAVTVGDPEAALAELEADAAPGFDYGQPANSGLPRPTPEKRAENFLTLVRALFQDPRLRHLDEVRQEWILRAPTEVLVNGVEDADGNTVIPGWLDFDGEDQRPALYPRLRAHEAAGVARQVERGVWLISERIFTHDPLVLADDAEDDDGPMDEAEVEDTLSDAPWVDA